MPPITIKPASPVTLRAGLADIGGLRYLRELLKLAARAWLHRRATRAWLAALNAQPLMAELLQSCPRLMYKIYRPYFSNTMRHEQRVRLLAEHYRFVASHGLANAVRQAARGALALGSVSGKSGTPYLLQLCAIGVMEREGELVLQLRDGRHVLYSVAFSFLGTGPGMRICIGCLQGPNHGDSLARLRAATRDLHGLRPKSLMLRLVRQLGYDYDCEQLILVGNENRTVHSATRQGKVHADYDAFWLESGARRRADGDFELDCEDLPAPALEAIASNKRAEARRRHATLTAMIVALRAGLHAACAAPPGKAGGGRREPGADGAFGGIPA